MQLSGGNHVENKFTTWKHFIEQMDEDTKYITQVTN